MDNMDNKAEKINYEELVKDQLKKLNLNAAAIAAGIKKELASKRDVAAEEITDAEVWKAIHHLNYNGDLRKDHRSMGMMPMPTGLESVTPIHAIRHLAAKGWKNKMTGLVGLAGWGLSGAYTYTLIAAQRAAKVVAEV